MTDRRVIVDHVLFVVRDLDASRRFYTAALATLGLQELHVQHDDVHYGAEGLDDFAIYVGEPVTTAAHVAFEAADREAVDAFFEAAVANGGRLVTALARASRSSSGSALFGSAAASGILSPPPSLRVAAR